MQSHRDHTATDPTSVRRVRASSISLSRIQLMSLASRKWEVLSLMTADFVCQLFSNPTLGSESLQEFLETVKPQPSLYFIT